MNESYELISETFCNGLLIRVSYERGVRGIPETSKDILKATERIKCGHLWDHE